MAEPSPLGAQPEQPSGGVFRILGWTVLSVVVIGLLAIAIWLVVGGGVWRGRVTVMEAALPAPDRLTLVVDSCNGDPELVKFSETDLDVKVLIVASSTPFLGGDDCADGLEVQLDEPLADRVVIDLSSGEKVAVLRNAP